MKYSNVRPLLIYKMYDCTYKTEKHIIINIMIFRQKYF